MSCQYQPRNNTRIFPGPATEVTKLMLTWTVWQGPKLKCAANCLWFSSPMVSIESQLLGDNRYSNSVVIYFNNDIKRRRSPYPSPLHSAQYTWHCFARLQQTRDARPFSRLRWHDLRSTPLHTATCRWSGIGKWTPLLRCLVIKQPARLMGVPFERVKRFISKLQRISRSWADISV